MLALHWKELLYQLVLFLVLLLILSKFLFIPLIKSLNKRDDRIAGSLKEAENLNMLSLKKEEEYRVKFNTARDIVIDENEKSLTEVKREAEELIHTAEMNARTKLEEAKKEILDESKKIETALQKKIDSFSELVITKLIYDKKA